MRTRRITNALAALGIAAGLFSVGATVAKAQDKSTDISKVERLNRAPVNKEILRVQLPKPTIVKLKNGLTLVLLEDHKLPTVDFSMSIRPGQLADPADMPGLAAFTAGMLREGTARRTSAQIAEEVDTLGASLNAGSGFGSSSTSVGASGLINNSAAILDLMSDIVLHPSFPASELAQYKQRQLSGLEQNFSNPTFLAQRTFRKMLYVDEPFSVTSTTKEAIDKITPDDLKKFHDHHYKPGNALFGVTGDFKTEDMHALIEKYFGDWAGAAEPPPALPKPAAAQPAKIILVDRPGSVQTYILAGDRGIRRADPDYYALDVMNQILGGGPQARMFLDLREEHGYTYGVYSSTFAETYPGHWLVATPVRTSVTDGSMTQLVYEMKKINTEPVPQPELEDARRTIVAGFALSLEQPNQVLGYWLSAQYYGFPADYWDKFPDRIAAVDDAAVQAAAKKYVDLAHMQWVAVGDRKQIQSVLAKFGPVTVVDAEGKPEN